jgi:hypothetical protein
MIATKGGPAKLIYDFRQVAPDAISILLPINV